MIRAFKVGVKRHCGDTCEPQITNATIARMSDIVVVPKLGSVKTEKHEKIGDTQNHNNVKNIEVTYPVLMTL